MTPVAALPVGVVLFALAAHFVIRHRIVNAERAEQDYQDWHEWVVSMHRDMTRFITVKQAAAEIRRPPSTVYTWIGRGRLPAVKTQRGHVRVRRAHVYEAEHAVRGKGRTPTSGRVA